MNANAFEMIVRPLLQGLGAWFLILAAGQSLFVLGLRSWRRPVDHDRLPWS